MLNTDNFKRGTMELVILSVLQEKDLYGYEIIKTVQEKSEGLYNIPLGTLYPVLYRFVENGYVSEWSEIIQKRLRKYYHLEMAGQNYYAELLKEYAKISSGIKKIIGGAYFD